MNSKGLAKAILLLFVGISVVVLLAQEFNKPEGPPLAAEANAVTTKGGSRIVLYYFHTTYRCPSCRQLEALAQSAIQHGFRRELDDGRLLWLPVNLEDGGNSRYIREYQLFTRSLVLVRIRNGRQVEWKNLINARVLLNDEAAFRSYVQDEVRAYLGAS
jgi:hypothetical protein